MRRHNIRMSSRDRNYVLDEAERLKSANDGNLSLYDVCCIALDIDRTQLKPVIDVLENARVLPYGTHQRLVDASTHFGKALAKSQSERALGAAGDV